MQVNQDWCDITVTVKHQGQGCSEKAESGTDLVQMYQEGGNCSSQGVNQLLLRRLFLQHLELMLTLVSR